MTFEIGKFYKTRDGRKAQCIWCCENSAIYRWVFGVVGARIVITTDDGLDWKGTTSPVDIVGPWVDTPDPGEGWRLLADEEVIQNGDEYHVSDDYWSQSVTSIGTTPANFDNKGNHCFIRRRIEPTKKYRPFASGEEFKPYRDKWWKYKGSKTVRPPVLYSDCTHDGRVWVDRFEQCEFEDGSPFGVEVSE